MAVPTVVATGSNTFTATTAPAITFSASPVENDILYIVLGTSAFPWTQQAITGWTNALGADNTQVSSDAHSAIAMWHRVTAAEDAANTVTWTLTGLFSTVETGALVGIAVNGVDTSLALDAFGSTFDSGNAVTPHVLAAVTAGDISVTDGLILRCVIKDGIGTYTTPAGHTQRVTHNVNVGMWFGTRDTAATAGVAIAATNITPSAGDEYIGITLVAPPPAVGDNWTVDEFDDVGITDTSVVVALASVQEETDEIGITDTAELAMGEGVEEQDDVGITDTVETASDISDSYTDNVGLLDSAVDALDNVDAYTDNVGITDSAVDALDVVDSYTDNIGITDSTTQEVGIVVTEIDDIGITDAALIAVDDVIEADAEPIGILDSVEVASNIIDAYTDNVGITDSIVIAAGEGVEVQENVGITDSVVIAVDNVLNIVDAVGISDNAVDSLAMVRSVTDTLGITDSVSTVEGVNELNICLEFGIPVFVSRSVGVEMIDREAAVAAVDRSADVAALNREAGLDMVDRGVTGTELVDRSAGVQIVDRAADIAIQDRTPGAPELEC